MRKLTFITGPIIAGVLLFSFLNNIRDWTFPDLFAVSVPVTFTDGNVLTAAQLNSNNTTIYNAFNGHDHDGSDGEPSTLSCSAIDTAVSFTGVPTFDSTAGGAAASFGPSSGSNDARIDLVVNQASANTWQLFVDNDEADELSFAYNATEIAQMGTTGDLFLSGEIALEGSNIAATSAPVADTIYPNSIVKAFGASASTGSSFSGERFNFNTLTDAGSANKDWAFHTAMATANYQVICTCANGAGCTVTSKTTAGFRTNCVTNVSNVALVLGTQ